MKKLITWTSLILAVSLFAEPGNNKGQLNVTYYTDFATDSALTRANAPAKNGTKFPTTK